MACMQTRSLKRGRVDTVSIATSTPTDADAAEVEAVAKAMLDLAAKGHVAAKAELEAAEKEWASKARLARLAKLVKAASSTWEAAKLRCTPIVEARGEIDRAALASLARAIFGMFDYIGKYVRKEAVHALGRLGQTILASYAGDIIGMFEDTYWEVRHNAVQALGKLEKAALACHTTALVGMLGDIQSDVRRRAMNALGNLDSAELTPHACAIIWGVLADADIFVCDYAVVLLCKLDKEALTPNASALVCALTYYKSDTCASGLLKKVKPAALARVEDILRELHGHQLSMRERAVRLFFVLDEEMISFHTEGIVGMLTDPNPRVQDCAIALIESNTHAVTPKVLSLVISTVTDKLHTGKMWSSSALPRLKRKLARLHWAAARVYRPVVRWYGWVWYEEACKTLHAPGGKWAGRDRVAFEAEFSGLLQ